MTNYFSFQHFRKMNVRFMLLKKIPLCMKLSVIMLFICVGLAYASDSYSQNVLLNIDVNNKSVQEVLDEIEKQSDFHFFYNNKQVNTSRIVSIKSKQKNVFNVLEQLFSVQSAKPPVHLFKTKRFYFEVLFQNEASLLEQNQTAFKWTSNPI